ncbi:hypothetical protein HDU78_001253 [Chytriomyces hyalinus]|nr:hypothetical protein HDU78_001253 [Chytriomyces hyalinus]
MLPLATLLAVLSASAFTAAQGVEVTCEQAAVSAQEAYDKCAALKPNEAAYNTCACNPTFGARAWMYNYLDVCGPTTFQSPLIKQLGCDDLQCAVGDAITMRIYGPCGLRNIPTPQNPMTPAQEACLCTPVNRDFFALYDATACSTIKMAPLCSGPAASATSSVVGAATSSVASAEGSASSKPAASASAVSSKTATAVATGATASVVASKNSASSVAASAFLVFGASLLL